MRNIEQSESSSSFISREQIDSDVPMIAKSSPAPEEASSFDDVDTAIASDMPDMESSYLGSEEISSLSSSTTGEPSIDLFWSAIIVLGIIIAGLAIEIGIKSRNSKPEETSS